MSEYVIWYFDDDGSLICRFFFGNSAQQAVDRFRDAYPGRNVALVSISVPDDNWI